MTGLIQVKRLSDGKVFSSDMSDTSNCIIEIHFCTSYTQVVVQETTGGLLIQRDIICSPVGSKPSWVDCIATQGSVEGEIL